jgi:uncharacterized membrane protein
VKRFDALSDGVFAIAMTILILEIKLPAHNADLLSALIAQWPSFAAYLATFVYLGVSWIAQVSTRAYVTRFDATSLGLGVLFLASVAFLPFPTALVADRLMSGDGLPIAAALYALTGLWLSLTGVGQFAYGLSRPELRSELALPSLLQGPAFWAGPSIYVVAFVLAFVATPVALAMMALIPSFYLTMYLTGRIPVVLVD